MVAENLQCSERAEECPSDARAPANRREHRSAGAFGSCPRQHRPGTAGRSRGSKNCLTPEEREVVELYYTQGLTQADIAEMKKMEEETVAQKLSRSRKKMKKAMEDEGRITL